MNTCKWCNSPYARQSVQEIPMNRKSGMNTQVSHFDQCCYYCHGSSKFVWNCLQDLETVENHNSHHFTHFTWWRAQFPLNLPKLVIVNIDWPLQWHNLINQTTEAIFGWSWNVCVMLMVMFQCMWNGNHFPSLCIRLVRDSHWEITYDGLINIIGI